jgi:hypothetical protein
VVKGEYKIIRKIGKLDSQEESGGKARVMLRVLLLGAGALGAFLVGKKALGAFQEKAAERGGGNSPVDVLARGLTHVQARLGPWSMRDLTLGLLAISKVASLSLSLSLSRSLGHQFCCAQQACTCRAAAAAAASSSSAWIFVPEDESSGLTFHN